jgi:hypothetical protein
MADRPTGSSRLLQHNLPTTEEALQGVIVGQ